jgi:hypothetical protein
MSRFPLLTGILLALVLVAAILCTVVTVFLPTVAQTLNIGAAPDRSWTPEPTITPTFTPEPTFTPTVQARPTVALPVDLPTPLPGNWTFQPGDVAVNVNTGPVNMRRSPGYKNKPASDRIALVPAGARVRILTGPARADGLIWWYVDWNGKQGWMAENRASGKPLLSK